MKVFLALVLCVCLTLCVLVSCNEDGSEVYTAPAKEQTETSETAESQTESETQEEGTTKAPEQTMGAIQEMIPKTD